MLLSNILEEYRGLSQFLGRNVTINWDLFLTERASKSNSAQMSNIKGNR